MLNLEDLAMGVFGFYLKSFAEEGGTKLSEEEKEVALDYFLDAHGEALDAVADIEVGNETLNQLIELRDAELIMNLAFIKELPRIVTQKRPLAIILAMLAAEPALSLIESVKRVQSSRFFGGNLAVFSLN